MAANLFGRYVWLLEQFRRYGRLTFNEINSLWIKSGLSYGSEDKLALRTFHNHRKAIFDIFDVEIACDKKDDYRYYIDHPEDLENDKLRSWIIDSYTAMNQIKADSKLKNRIIFEDVPSGHRWINVITDAMRNNHTLTITHQGFHKSKAYSFDIEPYCLKVSKRRWYVLARCPYYTELNRKKNKQDGGNRPLDVYKVFALDRISYCEPSGNTFIMNEDFDIDNYFKHCFGIIHSDDDPVTIVLKTHYNGAEYLRSLPLHQSQKELKTTDDGCTYFELTIQPTYDFYQEILSQGNQVEVIEPQSVRNHLREIVEEIGGYYEEE